MEKKTPNVEIFYSLLMVTAETVSKTIITSNEATGDFLKNVQTVVKVGPHVKAENGLDIKVGDKVLLNENRLYRTGQNGKLERIPGASIGEYICFDNETGEFDGFQPKETNTGYFIIDPRTVLCKV